MGVMNTFGHLNPEGVAHRFYPFKFEIEFLSILDLGSRMGRASNKSIHYH